MLLPPIIFYKSLTGTATASGTYCYKAQLKNTTEIPFVPTYCDSANPKHIIVTLNTGQFEFSTRTHYHVQKGKSCVKDREFRTREKTKKLGAGRKDFTE